jgi:hypothetical protein
MEKLRIEKPERVVCLGIGFISNVTNYNPYIQVNYLAFQTTT